MACSEQLTGGSNVATVLSVGALIAVVVGWFVTHLFTIRASKETLRRTLLNEARTALTQSIRSYHEWCSDVNGRLGGLAPRLRTDRSSPAMDMFEPAAQELRTLVVLDKRTDGWLRVLEEYEALIPETSRVRVDLLHRQMAIMRDLSALLTAAEKYAEQALASVDALQSRLMDMLGLSWDLLIHIQNRCFRDLTGYRAPERQPLDPNHPVVRLDAHSRQLVICETSAT